MTAYWYMECPVCHQGMLLIERDKRDDLLYLHCDECEFGWRDPELAHEPNAGFQTILGGFDFEIVSAEKIDAAGWGKYRLHSFEVQ
ncbi:MAG: hypothetical protein M3458_07495 [Acidobacteriota bacterium]|nr:hypothetical protein [Acidobacteriota bacterium]